MAEGRRGCHGHPRRRPFLQLVDAPAAHGFHGMNPEGDLPPVFAAC